MLFLSCNCPRLDSDVGRVHIIERFFAWFDRGKYCRTIILSFFSSMSGVWVAELS